MDDGFILVHRKTMKSQVWQTPELFKVWMWMLFKASFEETWFSANTGSGKTEVKVGPGEFVTGRFEAAKELKMKPSSAWKRIMKLKNIGNCDTKSDKHFTIISIVNWDRYQMPKNQREHQKEQPGDKQVTTREQAGDTYNKDNKYNKKDKYSCTFPSKRTSYPEEYESWWKEYPSKRRVAKQKCFGIWKRATEKPPIEIMLAKLEEQKKSRKWKNGYIVLSTTYLNQERWNEEMEPDTEESKWDVLKGLGDGN